MTVLKNRLAKRGDLLVDYNEREFEFNVNGDLKATNQIVRNDVAFGILYIR